MTSLSGELSKTLRVNNPNPRSTGASLCFRIFICSTFSQILLMHKMPQQNATGEIRPYTASQFQQHALEAVVGTSFHDLDPRSQKCKESKSSKSIHHPKALAFHELSR